MMPSQNRRTRHLRALGLGGLRRAVVLGRNADGYAPLQDAEDHLVLLEGVVVRNDGLGKHKGNGHVAAEHVRRERLDQSAKNSNLTLQEPFLKLTNSIKHPNLPQQNSNAVQKKRRYPLMKISRPSRRRGPDRRRAWQAQAPLAVTFRFHVPVGDLLIFVLLSGDASRVGIGFHWACRLISLAWHAIRPSISNLIHNALRVRTWRDGCS